MQSSSGGTVRETPGAVLTRTVPKALSQCGGVHYAIIFLDLTQFLAERAQGLPGIGYFPSLFLKLLIQEGSQSVKKCAFYSLTREAAFLLSLATLSQTYLSSILH